MHDTSTRFATQLLVSTLYYFLLCIEEKRSKIKAMDSLRGQGGIQMLLTAEQEAGRIVGAARSAKLARLKQAKDEAEKEMEEYRTRLEQEYQKQLSGTEQDAAAKQLEEETEVKIKKLKESSSKVTKEIVQMLIKYVTANGA